MRPASASSLSTTQFTVLLAIGDLYNLSGLEYIGFAGSSPNKHFSLLLDYQFGLWASFVLGSWVGEITGTVFILGHRFQDSPQILIQCPGKQFDPVFGNPIVK